MQPALPPAPLSFGPWLGGAAWLLLLSRTWSPALLAYEGFSDSHVAWVAPLLTWPPPACLVCFLLPHRPGPYSSLPAPVPASAASLIGSCPSCPHSCLARVQICERCGEIIALLFVLSQNLEEDFVCEDVEARHRALHTAANDGTSTMPRPLPAQRPTLCATLHSFGLEVLYADSRPQHRTSTSFEAERSGRQCHLQNDKLLRDIFGLGPVLVLDAAALKACQTARFEKHLDNAAALETQTEARGCVGDKQAGSL